jgi:hypothetical protein
MEKPQRIATLNDVFRRSGWGITLTQGVQALEDVAGLLEAVRGFDTFTEDNDPHHEHDFGSLKWEGQKIFWKIDYYEQNFQYWCDPLSSDCKRVMTVMLASEY